MVQRYNFRYENIITVLIIVILVKINILLLVQSRPQPWWGKGAVSNIPPIVKAPWMCAYILFNEVQSVRALPPYQFWPLQYYNEADFSVLYHQLCPLLPRVQRRPVGGNFSGWSIYVGRSNGCWIVTNGCMYWSNILLPLFWITCIIYKVWDAMLWWCMSLPPITARDYMAN